MRAFKPIAVLARLLKSAERDTIGPEVVPWAEVATRAERSIQAVPFGGAPSLYSASCRRCAFHEMEQLPHDQRRRGRVAYDRGMIAGLFGLNADGVATEQGQQLFLKPPNEMFWLGAAQGQKVRKFLFADVKSKDE